MLEKYHIGNITRLQIDEQKRGDNIEKHENRVSFLKFTNILAFTSQKPFAK